MTTAHLTRILFWGILAAAAPAFAANTSTGTASISTSGGYRVSSVGGNASIPLDQQPNANYIRAGAVATNSTGVSTIGSPIARPIEDASIAKPYVGSKASVNMMSTAGKLNVRPSVRAGSVGFDSAAYVAGISH